MHLKNLTLWIILLILTVFNHTVLASSNKVAPVNNALYAEECGACHFAYQPVFLPERSWSKLMSTLDQHFEENAELDEEDQKMITDYLVKHAGTRRSRGDIGKFIRSIPKEDTPLRITNIPYFVKEHREIPHHIIKEKVGGLSNCNACHKRAHEGSYREREINIPGYGRWDD